MRYIILLFMFLLAGIMPSVSHAEDGEYKSTYDRVMDTKTLRCGYVVYAPFLMKDPNTQEMSGIFFDIMKEAGKLLSLKIEWAEEAGTPTLIEGLRSGRLDALCTGFWPNAARGREADFSRPLFFSVLGLYVRADDHRFDKDFSLLNMPDIKVAVVDGEMADQIAGVSFPSASKFSLPQMTNVYDLLMNVDMGKADFTISGVNEERLYSQTNPNKIRRIDAKAPIRTFPNVVMVGKGEQKFLSTLNSAFDELDNTGLLNQIISRYEKTPGEFYRVAKQYEVSQ